MSLAGPARARALAPLMTWRWRRRTTSATRASSAASRFSILIRRTPSRFSIRAVDKASLSTMAPAAALRVRLPNVRSTSDTTGMARSTTAVSRQSIQAM